jgi:hypothetical protein
MAAGVTDRLWSVEDLVALWEAYERRGGKTGSMSTSAQYEVYVSYPNNKAVGHIVGCPHAKVWGGDVTAAGGHLGPFSSRDEAESQGRATGQRFHWCGHCRGLSK